MAGSVATVMTDPKVAELVKHSTDTIQVGHKPFWEGEILFFFFFFHFFHFLRRSWNFIYYRL